MKVPHSLGSPLVLLGLGMQELEALALAQGQPAFRGRQIYDWLYKKGVNNLDEMSVLPKAWRTLLKEKGFSVGRLDQVKKQVSCDETTKLLLETFDGENIETVGIPTENRLTVCVSSQVGCPMACRFCATGKGGLQRSLETHEIVDQFLSVRDTMNRQPTHVVFMGMGEPLLNIEAVLQSINCINNDLGIGQRRITISTVGVANTLADLGELALEKLGRAQFTLAISLHAPNQQIRESLIPTARNYPIDLLLKDCRKYIALTGRRVTFEYILIGDLNDHISHASELAKAISRFQSHVNLIPYNPIEGEAFKRPTLKRIHAFQKILKSKGIAVSVRKSRGLDKNAACGQLRRQFDQISHKS